MITKQMIKDLEEMSQRAVARKYGIHEATFRYNLKKHRGKIADNVNPDMVVKSTSTKYDSDGNVQTQWVKEDAKKADEIKLYKDSIEGLAGSIEPLEVVREPTIADADLLTNYIVTDMHLGLLAHQSEAGNNVDSEIVYAHTLSAMEILVASSPNSETAIVSDLGDTLHSANDDNRTKSGHILDVDGRHSKLFTMVVKLKIKMLEMALKKHQKVKYIIVAGNHSDLIAIYLKAVIGAKFENEPRLEIEMDNSIHQYHKFGKVLLGYTHSHTTKATRLPTVMVADNIDIISETRYRFFHCGHYHSAKLLDDPLCMVEHHRNLTNNDFYSQSAGFRTNKEMKAITYHREYGEWTRNTAPLALVEDYIRECNYDKS